MNTAENILLFDTLFAILLVSYGVSIGVADLTTVQTLTPPTLAPLPPGITCAWYDYVCEGTKGITQATAYIGWAFVNLPVIIIFMVAEGILMGSVILGLVFSPQFSSQGVPYVGFFFIALQLFVVWEVFRSFWPGGSGAGGGRGV